jgi:hypothetical protein
MLNSWMRHLKLIDAAVNKITYLKKKDLQTIKTLFDQLIKQTIYFFQLAATPFALFFI